MFSWKLWVIRSQYWHQNDRKTILHNPCFNKTVHRAKFHNFLPPFKRGVFLAVFVVAFLLFWSKLCSGVSINWTFFEHPDWLDSSHFNCWNFEHLIQIVKWVKLKGDEHRGDSMEWKEHACCKIKFKWQILVKSAKCRDGRGAAGLVGRPAPDLGCQLGRQVCRKHSTLLLLFCYPFYSDVTTTLYLFYSCSAARSTKVCQATPYSTQSTALNFDSRNTVPQSGLILPFYHSLGCAKYHSNQL